MITSFLHPAIGGLTPRYQAGEFINFVLTWTNTDMKGEKGTENYEKQNGIYGRYGDGMPFW